MKKICIVILIIFIASCVGIFASCQPNIDVTIEIIGDVRAIGYIDNYDSPRVDGFVFDRVRERNVTVSLDGKQSRTDAISIGILMGELSRRQTSGDSLGFSYAVSGYFSAIFVASDYTTCKVFQNDYEGLYLYYDIQYNWCMYSSFHPEPVKLRDIITIIITEELPETYTDEFWGVRVIGDDCNYLTMSVGNQLESNRIHYSAGALQTKNNITVKKGKWTDFDITDIAINLDEEVGALMKYATIFTNDSDIVTISLGDSNGVLSIDKTNIIYNVDGQKYKVWCIGLSDNIDDSIACVAGLIQQSLESNTVIIVELDGLSFEQWIDNDCLTALNSMLRTGAKATDKMLYSVLPTKSEVGLATLLSGKSPKFSGVVNHYNRAQFTKDTIFDKAAHVGKTSSYFEGNSVMLPTVPLAQLSASDSVTYNKLINGINSGMLSDLTYLHLHEVDDDGSKYGPNASETIGKINQQLTYIANIFDKAVALKGNNVVLYIVSDHGMHPTTSGGYHTTATYQDMIVPLVTIRMSV